ncbi:hypothetical protein DFR52_101243 [Hoeflea marina]|uniref:Uncharacterized protein n=1 Tax=Hoeflea marina TaxID=274592 RepID=A0A317PQ22_9HYPH|nr:hypothetical protein [Hoeflea marina]PWW03562.1 hypothetical protein DFR52_101243 [Hoeflea marina]
MAKNVVFGLPGEAGLWIADLDAGTVAPLEVEAGSALATADELRRGGATVVKGVNLALSVDIAGAAFSGFMDS